MHALTTRYGDGSLTFFEDDAKSKYTTSSPAPSATGDFWFGWLIATSNYARYKFAALAIYTRALSDAEVRAAYYALKAYCSTTSALSISTNTKYVTAEGDSRTFGYATTDQLGGYGDRAGTSLTTAIGTTNAVSSAKLGVNGDAEAANTLWGRKARDLAVIPASKNGKLYILSILIGYTDFAGYGTNGYTQYAADVATYAAAMKAGGYDRIILCTELPSTSAGYNAWRNALNAIYTGASWTTNNGIDALCRLDQIAGMGADADASGTNYADGLHPSNAGQILIAPVWAATVNGIT